MGGADLPKPAAVIVAYTGHNWFTPDDSPTFSVVSEDDPIASASVMSGRIKAMQDAGVDAEIHIYRHAGHGFGTGEGTDAAGWMKLALDFWKRHLSEGR